MTPKEKRTEIARLIREAATKNLQEGLRVWSDDKDMLQMVRGDSRDLRGVAQLIRANKIDEARRKADSMDTAAREIIPDKAWDWMHKEDDEG